MTNKPNNLEEEQDQNQPIDPAFDNVRRKLVRLMVVSVAIMVIGISAVLVAIIMKMNSNKVTAANDWNSISQVNLLVPKTLSPISQQLNNNVLSIEFKDEEGRTSFLLFDTVKKVPLTRINLQYSDLPQIPQG